MKSIDSIHIKAMEIAQQAFLAQKNGNENEFITLSKEAFLLEKQAAMILRDKYDTEPNRTILFKSAAFLAFDAKEYNECKNMIVYALLGSPDNETKEELTELFTDILKEMQPQTVQKQHVDNPKKKLSGIYTSNREKLQNIKYL